MQTRGGLTRTTPRLPQLHASRRHHSARRAGRAAGVDNLTVAGAVSGRAVRVSGVGLIVVIVELVWGWARVSESIPAIAAAMTVAMHACVAAFRPLLLLKVRLMFFHLQDA